MTNQQTLQASTDEQTAWDKPQVADTKAQDSKYIVVFTDKPVPTFYGEYRVEVIDDVEAFNETILQASSGFVIDSNFLKVGEDLISELYGIIENKEETIYYESVGFMAVNGAENKPFYYHKATQTLTSLKLTDNMTGYLKVIDEENLTHGFDVIKLYANFLDFFNPNTDKEVVLTYNQKYDNDLGHLVTADCFIGTPKAVVEFMETIDLKGDKEQQLTISTLLKEEGYLPSQPVDLDNIGITGETPTSSTTTGTGISTDFTKRD